MARNNRPREKSRAELLEDAARQLHTGNRTAEDYINFGMAANNSLKQGVGIGWFHFVNAIRRGLGEPELTEDEYEQWRQAT